MAEPVTGGASRRVFLASTGAACAAMIAGCSTYNANNGGVNGPPPSQPPPSGGTPAGGGASAASGTPAAGGAAVLASTASVPVGGGKILTAQQIVITQPTAGSYKAFTAVCTHQGCIVSTVADGTIDCPCHGSKFSVKDGSVVNGPAPSPLAAVAIKVEGASIVRG
jgi:Rieske Fe-S protein